MPCFVGNYSQFYFDGGIADKGAIFAPFRIDRDPESFFGIFVEVAVPSVINQDAVAVLCRFCQVIKGFDDVTTCGIFEQSNFGKTVVSFQNIRHRFCIGYRSFQRRPEFFRVVIIIIADHQCPIFSGQIWCFHWVRT